MKSCGSQQDPGWVRVKNSNNVFFCNSDKWCCWSPKTYQLPTRWAPTSSCPNRLLWERDQMSPEEPSKLIVWSVSKDEPCIKSPQHPLKQDHDGLFVLFFSNKARLESRSMLAQRTSVWRRVAPQWMMGSIMWSASPGMVAMRHCRWTTGPSMNTSQQVHRYKYLWLSKTWYYIVQTITMLVPAWPGF